MKNIQNIVRGMFVTSVIFFTFSVLSLFFVYVAHADTCYVNTATGGAGFEMNSGAGYPMYAGTYAAIFSPSLTCNLGKVTLRGRVGAGSPSDGFVVEFWSTLAGVPNALVETGTLAPTTGFTGSYSDTSSDFTFTSLMTAGTTYAIVVKRGCCAGSYDNANYAHLDGGAGATVLGSDDAGATWVNTYQLPQSMNILIEGTPSGPTPPTPTSTPSTTNKQEFAFMFGVIVFLLSVPFWDRALTVTAKAYDV